MPAISSTDLIVAPATTAAGGGRGIVRIAGTRLPDLLDLLVSPAGGGWPAPGDAPRVVRGTLHPDGLGREWGHVPVAVLSWPGPQGPTRGPLAEVQLPGSPPLVSAFVAEACRHGARLARGGEFSLRSFLAGTIDLVQAEAVLAVVDAQTPAQLAAALDRMAGGAGRTLESLRDAALDLVADVEAAIDFADEATPDAVPAGVPWDVLGGRVEALITGLGAVSRQLAGREATTAEGLPRAVLVGRPNIGKSSLFNAVVGRPAALVADEIGTTRDWVAAPLNDAAGHAACMLVDVAGVGMPATGPLVAEVAAQAAAEIARADVLVACRDAAELGGGAEGALPPARRVVHVVTRADRVADFESGEAIATSSRTGRGIDQLRRAILAAAAAAAADRAPATLRMRAGIDAAATALVAARQAVAAARAGEADEAVVAGCLHQAIDAIHDVTGRELGTDLLDRIFSRHCIGK